MHTSGPVNMDTAEKNRAKEKHHISKSKCVKRPWIEGAFFYPCEGDVLETKALMFRQEDLTAARLYRKKSWNQMFPAEKPQRRHKAAPGESTVTVRWCGRHFCFIAEESNESL